MDDPYTVAGVVGSLILASASLVGLYIERAKRKDDEAQLLTLKDGVGKIGQAVLQLEAVVGELRSLATQTARGVVVAEKVGLWAKLGTAINAVRLALDFLDR